MHQDINKIIDTISQLHAATSIEDKKQIAILMEENERLRQEINLLSESNQVDSED